MVKIYSNYSQLIQLQYLTMKTNGARIKYEFDKMFLVFSLLMFADFFCCNEMRESRDFDLRNLIIIFLLPHL